MTNSEITYTVKEMLGRIDAKLEDTNIRLSHLEAKALSTDLLLEVIKSITPRVEALESRLKNQELINAAVELHTNKKFTRREKIILVTAAIVTVGLQLFNSLGPTF